MSTGLQIVAAIFVVLLAIMLLCIAVEMRIAKIPTQNFPQKGGDKDTEL